MNMEQGYWFKSDLFQITKGEDDETNPGCYGRELANWLCIKFQDRGYDVEEVFPEDWGWCVMCYRGDYLLWIGCSSVFEDSFYDTYDPDRPPEGNEVVWHVFPAIEMPFFYFKSWFRRLIGTLDTYKPLQKLDQELKYLLESEQRIEFCEEP
jgi:hypothetical protein